MSEYDIVDDVVVALGLRDKDDIIRLLACGAIGCDGCRELDVSFIFKVTHLEEACSRSSTAEFNAVTIRIGSGVHIDDVIIDSANRTSVLQD